MHELQHPMGITFNLVQEEKKYVNGLTYSNVGELR